VHTRHLSTALSLSLSLSRVVVPSMLTDPLRRREPSARGDLLLPNIHGQPGCLESYHDVTERCRVWSICLTWPKRVTPSTYSFTYGWRLWEGGNFHVRNKFWEFLVYSSPMSQHHCRDMWTYWPLPHDVLIWHIKVVKATFWILVYSIVWNSLQFWDTQTDWIAETPQPLENTTPVTPAHLIDA